MAKNEFLPFGTAANANVLPNADYQALPARVAGFSGGVAKSEETQHSLAAGFDNDRCTGPVHRR